MPRPGPILIYSIYQPDIPRFERLIARALPDVAIACARTPEEAAPYLDDAVILYGWGFPPEMLGRMPKLRWLQKMGGESTTSSRTGRSVRTSCSPEPMGP